MCVIAPFRLLILYQPFNAVPAARYFLDSDADFIELPLARARSGVCVWCDLAHLARDQGVVYADLPALLGRRSRAIGIVAAVILPVVLLVSVIPLPASSTLPGVVESVDLQIVR